MSTAPCVTSIVPVLQLLGITVWKGKRVVVALRAPVRARSNLPRGIAGDCRAADGWQSHSVRFGPSSYIPCRRVQATPVDAFRLRRLAPLRGCCAKVAATIAKPASQVGFQPLLRQARHKLRAASQVGFNCHLRHLPALPAASNAADSRVHGTIATLCTHPPGTSTHAATPNTRL